MIKSHAKCKCGHIDEVNALTLRELAHKISAAAYELCTACRIKRDEHRDA